jgi:hypothetical protein
MPVYHPTLSPDRRLICVLSIVTSVVLCLLTVSPTLAQTSPPTEPTPPIDPKALVQRAVQHRFEGDASHHPVRYLFRRTDARRDTTKEIFETRDGDVARLVAVDGRPLTSDEDRAELDRLDTLAQHPELQEHRRKSELKDTERTTHLMKQLPEAFLYEIVGTAPCNTGSPAKCYRLSFKPNPNWSAPDLESGIFRGIAGEAWIDQAQERLTRIDARFIDNVDFGLGILGKLNKGSTALIEQADVGTNGEHDWELTTLKLNVTGKALLVRTLNFNVVERASHYIQVTPNLSYRDAIKLLKSSPSPLSP